MIHYKVITNGQIHSYINCTSRTPHFFNLEKGFSLNSFLKKDKLYYSIMARLFIHSSVIRNLFYSKIRWFTLTKTIV